MSHRRIFTSLIIVVFVVIIALLSVAGTSADPLLTVSYFSETYLPGVAQRTAQKLESGLSSALSSAESRGRSIRSEKLAADTKDSVAKELAREIVSALIASERVYAGGFRKAYFTQGEQISGSAAASFYVESGTFIYTGSGLIDLTAGGNVASGSALKSGVYYIFSEEPQAVLRVNSASASLRLNGAVKTTPFAAKHRDFADALKLLGLFKGTDKGYELGREATRLEGLVMLIRLLGEEQQALSYTGQNPFTDVPAWGDRYVAYAYSKGYTNGISKTLFGASNYITGAQYVTMVLRALGYDDAAGDFVWDKSFDKAVSVGLYTASSAAAAQSGVFLRDQVVEASCNALFIGLKNTNVRLIDNLSGRGVFTAEIMELAVEKINKAR